MLTSAVCRGTMYAMSENRVTGPRAEHKNSGIQVLPFDDSGKSWHDVRTEIAKYVPDYYVISEVASRLGITVRAVQRSHLGKLGTPKLVQFGERVVSLWPKDAVERHVRARAGKTRKASRMAFRGIEVERLQRVCERYYRQNLDRGEPELLALAKRVAKL